MFVSRKEFDRLKAELDTHRSFTLERMDFYNSSNKIFNNEYSRQVKECLAECQKTRELFVDIVMLLLDDPYIERRVFERHREAKGERKE